MQQSHVADLPTTTLQPQVSTTNKPGLVPITVAHLSGQPTIHIVDQSSTALHLPMQSPIQSSLPTPPSSATRMTLQYSPDPQTSQFRPVTASVPTSCTQPRTSTDYINLNNHSSGERVIVQRQVTGPGCVFSITVLAPILLSYLTVTTLFPRPSPGDPCLPRSRSLGLLLSSSRPTPSPPPETQLEVQFILTLKFKTLL